MLAISVIVCVACGKNEPGALYEGLGDPFTVPEPWTLILVGSGLAAIGLSGRRGAHRD